MDGWMDGWMDIYSTVLALARRNIRQWRMHLNSGSSGAPKAPMSVIYCVLVWWWCIYSKELCGVWRRRRPNVKILCSGQSVWYSR
jgi:hypothetical protein